MSRQQGERIAVWMQVSRRAHGGRLPVKSKAAAAPTRVCAYGSAPALSSTAANTPWPYSAHQCSGVMAVWKRRRGTGGKCR